MDSSHAVRSAAALNRDAIAKSRGLWILIGPDPEIHLADGLVRHLLEEAEPASSAHGWLQVFIGNFKAIAIAEFEEGLDRIAAGVVGIGGEKQLETAVGLLHHEIGVPVGAADCFAKQPLGSLNLFFRNRSPPPTWGRKPRLLDS